MVDILLAWADSRDWAAALNSVVPGRKRAAAEPAKAASEPAEASQKPSNQPSSSARAGPPVQAQAGTAPEAAQSSGAVAVHQNGGNAGDSHKSEPQSEDQVGQQPLQAEVKSARDAADGPDAEEKGDDETHASKRQRLVS